MIARAASPRRLSLPISGQILGLLLGGLVVAQLVTLLLTLLLPPQPLQQHSLAEIATALRGGDLAGRGRPLVRSIDTAPPSLQSPGWLVSQRSTADLARMLGVPEADVRLLFYAPPPPGGAAPPPRAELHQQLVLASFAFFEQPGPSGGGAPPPGGPGGGFPGGPPPGGEPGSGYPPPSGAQRPQAQGQRSPSGGPQGGPRSGPGGGPGGARRPGPGGPGGPGAVQMAPPPVVQTIPRSALDSAVFGGNRDADPVIVNRPPDIRLLPAPAITEAAPPVTARQVPEASLTLAPAAATAADSATADAAASEAQPGRPLAAPANRGLFGLAPAPYVEGEFVAALRTGPGRWVTVKPRPEPFPNSWQRQILLWFAISFALVAPLGWLFARRLAAPLADFATAAERLGRDPQAEVSTREGPAEVGRAARAFNLMQRRLKRYIEDRTGMIGAISHDLRTPLARMRFRLERASPELRTAMSRDIAQMEEMITSVLAFMRDDAAGAKRERVDLRSILEVVVDDAEAAGAEIALEPGPPAEVEVDLMGVQRVFENLVDNAIKYGDRAAVRLSLDQDEAVIEIADTGPGLPDAELEQVFKPFYRGSEARTSSKGGVGLGLAVSRSTVRAHGGELKLARASNGLVAEVRLPLARPSAVAA
jgi:two-component system OmpR family sensor kinase